ncbi:MAG TPA: DUF2851 family protein [Flavobacterium sp.]|nr:DUF2851 family protein [Flavobacterium sp.]
MKEDFLHYLWKFKKFDSTNLKTFNGETIAIVHSGQYLQLAGPDFFNAQIIIGKQRWAGNVEIHVQSSDWYLHHHETDSAYENVILHVVWKHDAEIFRKNNTEIPVLELQHYVANETLENYQSLTTQKSWIFCERRLASIDEFVLRNWQERLFFERLERKSIPISQILSDTANDWEAVLFCLLAKNFGLNTNGDIFMQIAKSIPFAVIRKEQQEPENLEALLFGRAGLLDVEKEDIYFKYLKSSWEFLSHKYQLPETHIEPVQFFKHRPDNFPTIRLAQFAQLYHLQHHLFSKAMAIDSAAAFYGIFKVDVSGYWQSHYQFDKLSPKKPKPLTVPFMDLLLVNSIIPLQFAYAKSQGKDISGQLIDMMASLPAEKNTIIEKFGSFGVKSKTAFETQSLLQLKNDYCNKSRCLECAIGAELMKALTEDKNL